VIPISEHQDTVGAMARTVRDAAYLLTAIAGPDPRDNYTLANPAGNKSINYEQACDYSALKGKRFGVPWNIINYYSAAGPNTTAISPAELPVITAFNASLALIEKAGGIIVETDFSPLAAYNSGGNETIVLDADFIVNLKTYLDELTYNPNNITDLESLRDWTESFPGEDWSPTSRDGE